MDYRQQLAIRWVESWADFMRLDIPSDYMISRVVESVKLLSDDEVLDLLGV